MKGCTMHSAQAFRSQASLVIDLCPVTNMDLVKHHWLLNRLSCFNPVSGRGRIRTCVTTTRFFDTMGFPGCLLTTSRSIPYHALMRGTSLGPVLTSIMLYPSFWPVCRRLSTLLFSTLSLQCVPESYIFSTCYHPLTVIYFVTCAI